MKLIISFSGRANGNCDQIASFLATENDRIVPFRELNIHPCADCAYECFNGACIHRTDDIYALYESMQSYDKVVLIVPMYCANPSSLYFIFHERGQDYFLHNDVYDALLAKLYIIGVYGRWETNPNFIPGFENWFADSVHKNHVLGIERHIYGQKMQDSILEIEEVKAKIAAFIND